MGKPIWGKRPWQCKTTGLDNSTELPTEKIHQAVTEIWVPQIWQPPVTIPFQPWGLRGKNSTCHHLEVYWCLRYLHYSGYEQNRRWPGACWLNMTQSSPQNQSKSVRCEFAVLNHPPFLPQWIEITELQHIVDVDYEAVMVDVTTERALTRKIISVSKYKTCLACHYSLTNKEGTELTKCDCRKGVSLQETCVSEGWVKVSFRAIDSSIDSLNINSVKLGGIVNNFMTSDVEIQMILLKLWQVKVPVEVDSEKVLSIKVL